MSYLQDTYTDVASHFSLPNNIDATKDGNANFIFSMIFEAPEFHVHGSEHRPYINRICPQVHHHRRNCNQDTVPNTYIRKVLINRHIPNRKQHQK